LSATFFSAAFEVAVSFKSSVSSLSDFLTTLDLDSFTSFAALSLYRLSGVPSFLVLTLVSSTSLKR